jgi:hypothetical protein
VIEIILPTWFCRHSDSDAFAELAERVLDHDESEDGGCIPPLDQ